MTSRPPTCHAVRIDDDVVLLSEDDQEYGCLIDAAPKVAVVSRALQVGDPDLVAQLREAGWIDATSSRLNHCARPAAPRRDLYRRRVARPRLGDRIAMAHAWLAMLRHYHFRSFRHLLAIVRAPAPSRAKTSELADMVAVFEAMMPWIPGQGVCLYRSFMLLLFLRLRGLDAQLVFGVRTWPFEAHCWLQHEDLVLDDLAEQVATFTPILVAGR